MARIASSRRAASGPGAAPARTTLLTDHPLASHLGQPTRRRASVWERAIRRDLSRLHDPRRLLAILLLAIAGAIFVVWTVSRGELAGADARAYWAGVRVWIGGGDPYHPGGTFLPYVYAPWLLPLFLPWALLPWSVAWFAWRWGTLLFFLWSVDWAYRRRPLATAVSVALLTPPFIATLDTGNVTLLLALAIWAAQFSGPLLGGALWALAASMKWFPAVLFLILPPRARLWGLVGLAVSIGLALLTWPETLVQLDTVINFPRPLRIDYAVIVWGAVPWLWRHPRPLWWMNRRELPGAVASARATVSGWWHGFRSDPVATRGRASKGLRARARAFLGLG